MFDRNSMNVKNVAMIVFLVAVSSVGIWTLMQPGTTPSPGEGQKIADAFLAAMQGDSPDKAWESTTAEFKSAEGRESFSRFVKKNDFLSKPLEFVSTQLVDVQDQQRAEFVYRAAPKKTTVRLVIGRELGVWKVDRLAVDNL